MAALIPEQETSTANGETAVKSYNTGKLRHVPASCLLYNTTLCNELILFSYISKPYSLLLGSQGSWERVTENRAAACWNILLFTFLNLDSVRCILGNCDYISKPCLGFPAWLQTKRTLWGMVGSISVSVQPSSLLPLTSSGKVRTQWVCVCVYSPQWEGLLRMFLSSK